mmetsp:Transcript_73133/g.169601  ORF Transcript_73133/g.169601 Transcript_73133/m.169601 type:complete len:252 (+) Transcript_73133:47-802(+)
MDSAIREVEEAVATLSSRVDGSESQMRQVQDLLVQLAEQVAVLEAAHRNALVPAAVEEQLCTVEAQLQIAETQLNVEERSIHTVESVVASIAGLTSILGVPEQCDAPAGQVAAPVLAPGGEQWGPLSQQWSEGVGSMAPPIQLEAQSLRGDLSSGVEGTDLPPQPVMQPMDQAPFTQEKFPSLERNGQQPSLGSTSHPNGCRPCSFFCYSKGGCRKGLGCEYCHMLHLSRSTRRLRKLSASENPRDARREA